MQFRSLPGLTPYEEARKLQLDLVELRAQDKIEDTILFLEHEPVVTRGRGLQFTGVPRDRHVPLAAPLPAGIAFAESERGGDLTYHGPGQLVIYPIVKLDGQGFGPRHDIAGFLRIFEQVVIDWLSELGAVSGANDGFRAMPKESATGVWVEPRKIAPLDLSPRKIASMGIAVRRWVTYHGLAINCVNDLRAFQWISPCGFSPEVMTRLQDWLDPASVEAARLCDWTGNGRAWVEAELSQRLAAARAAIVAAASHILDSGEASEKRTLRTSLASKSAPTVRKADVSEFVDTAMSDEATQA